MSNQLSELPLPLQDRLLWSQESYAERFALSYRLISGGGRTVVGASEIARNLFSGRRWVHWESSAGVICLKEIWLDSDLVDHAICLQLGDLSLGSPLSVHCETTSFDKNEIAVRISFAMSDGSLHNMTFRSSAHSRSIFADLVDYKAGGVVSSRCDSLPYLKTPEFALLRTHQISESIREGQTITCAAHLSHFGVVFGLNQGDIVYVRAASDGLYVETVLRSEWVLTSLLSGFLGSNRKAGILAVSGAHLKDYSILVSVSADGVLRVWDCLSRSCLQEISVMSLIDPEIASDPSQGVVMEGVCLDTAPFDLLVTTGQVDPNALGLTIALGVTVRVGRDRSWNIALLSWSPARAGLPVRAYLRPIVVPPSMNSADISLEQISLSPAQVLQSHCGCDLVATLWNMDGDIIPVSYSTSGLDWSNTGHTAAALQDSSAAHIDPTMIPYNPAESRVAALSNDKSLLESIAGNVNRDSMIWTATGMPHNTVDMGYLSSQITSTFLQRMFSPGRFAPQDLIEVLCLDVPYELQLNRATFEELYVESMEESMELLLESVLTISKAMERARPDISTSSDPKREVAFTREHLELQIQVSLSLLAMCEDRKRQRLSCPGSCTILTRTAGLSPHSRKEERSYLRPLMPFHFAIVRPASLGIVVKLESLSSSTASGFVHSPTTPQVESAMNEIFSRVSEVLQAAPEMLHFDSALTRFVADVVTIDCNSTSWILSSVQALVPPSSRLAGEVHQILAKYRSSSEEALQSLGQLLRSDLLWGENPLAESTHSHHSVHGSFAALLLKEYSTLMVRERYAFLKTLLFSFAIILQGQQGQGHEDDLSQVLSSTSSPTSAHIPSLSQAVYRLMYDSYLLWASGLYLSSSSVEDRVDFKDVQYDASVMRHLLQQQPSPTSSSSSSSSQPQSLSVWSSYWLHLIPRLSLFQKNPRLSFWQNVSHEASSALFQSCHNDLIAFLYARGQYALVTRACAIAHLLYSASASGSASAPSLSQSILRSHEATMVAISQLQAHLSDVANFPLGAGDNSDELTPELCQSVEALLSIPVLPPASSFSRPDRSLSAIAIASSDSGDKNLIDAHIRSWLSLQQQQQDKTTALPIADTLTRLAERSSSFRILFLSLVDSEGQGRQGQGHPMSVLLECHPQLLMKLSELCHRSNSLTLLDRSRAVLPSSRSGDELTLAAAQETIELLRRLSQELQAEGGTVASAILREIQREVVAVWSNVFNLAIHSQLLDRALEAVTTLFALSQQPLSEEYPLTQHWRHCLRSLIFTACSSGNIVWLCSLPDSVLATDGCNYGSAYLDLTQEISAELESLARSSDLMSLSSPLSSASAFDSSETDAAEESLSSLANFYDCLTSFLVCKKQFAHCAHLQFQLVERLSGASQDLSTVSLPRLKLQQRCLSAAISTLWCLPPSQRFITHEQRQKTSPSSLRSSTSSSGLTAGPAAVLKSYLTLRDLEHRHLQVQCRLFLSSRTQQRVGLSTDLDLVRALCEEGNFVDALCLATHSDPSPAQETNAPLAAVIASFSSQCAALSSSSAHSPTTTSTEQLEEQFLSSLGCVPHPLQHSNQSADKHLWEYLLNALHLLDRPGQGLLLHQTATQAALSLSLRRQLQDRVPLLLANSFAGNGLLKKRSREGPASASAVASSVSSGARHSTFEGQEQEDGRAAKKGRGNLDSLLRTLVSQGCLVDACQLASAHLACFHSASPQQQKQGQQQQLCLPLTTLDQLLFACDTALKLSEHLAQEQKQGGRQEEKKDVEQEAVAVLRGHYETLRGDLSRYFAELFQQELLTK